MTCPVYGLSISLASLCGYRGDAVAAILTHPVDGREATEEAPDAWEVEFRRDPGVFLRSLSG